MLGVVGVALAALGYKAYQYSADPLGPKPCTFIYPLSPRAGAPPTTSVPPPANVPFAQTGGTINDASCLNQTEIYGVVAVRTEDDVRNALQFARDHGLKVTPAGARHSMGGQTFSRGGVVLDMRGFNQISVDKERRVLRAQSGALWKDIQELLDREGLSMKAVQSINIFSVGGTLSVNAHGIAHDPGPIAPTIRSMRVMTSDGLVHETSPTQEPDLFGHVLGGYGLFGVILDVEIDVMPNEIYRLKTDYMDYRQFPEYFAKNIAGNSNIGLFYGRLSMSPESFLRETATHRYERTQHHGPMPALKPQGYTWLNRLAINFSKTGGLGRWVRSVLEKHVEPRVHLCQPEAGTSGEGGCLVSRNQEMYDAMEYLRNRLPDTDILQEYFIPHARMPEFIDGLRGTVQRNGANLVNVTIRIVSKDTVTALPYAKQDMFAFVLYFNQEFNEKESAILRKTTTDLIDVATGLGGTYYLPYQLYYSPQQLRRAYPEADAFFEAKRKFDPDEIFTNKFYETYGKPQDSPKQ